MTAISASESKPIGLDAEPEDKKFTYITVYI